MLREACHASLSFLIWTSRRDARRYLRARNRQLPGASLFQPEIHPFPLFPLRSSPLKNAQLQIPTVNRRFSRALPVSSPPLFRSFAPPLCNLLFPLSPLDFLGELSLFLLLFLCLFFSFSRVLDSRILDPGSFSFSLSPLSCYLALLSLDASGLSRCTLGT